MSFDVDLVEFVALQEEVRALKAVVRAARQYREHEEAEMSISDPAHMEWESLVDEYASELDHALESLEVNSGL